MQQSSTGWIRLTLLVVLIIIALPFVFVSICVFFPDSLKPVAAYLTREYTGRSLVIEGPLKLDFSLEPRLVARGLHFGNAPGTAHLEMASADYLMLQIDLAALLERRLHFLDLDLRSAEIRLEDPVDATPNWVFFEEAETAEGEVADRSWTLMVESLSVSALKIFAEIGELKPMELEVEALGSEGADGNLRVDGQGQLNGGQWSLTGKAGSLDSIISGGRVDLDLAMVIDDVEAEARGSIGELSTLSMIDLTLNVRGPDAEVLGGIFGTPEAFAGDVALTAVIAPDVIGHRISAEGHIAAFELALAGTVRNLQIMDGWDVEMNLSGPEAEVVTRALQMPGLARGPFSVEGRVHLHGGDLDLTDVNIRTTHSVLVLSADFVDFPRSAGATANIRLNGPDVRELQRLLGLEILPEAPFQLEVTLSADGGGLASRLAVGSHELRLEGTIGEYPSFLGTRLAASIQGADLAEVIRLFGAPDTLSDAYRATTVLTVSDGGLSASDVDFRNGPFRLTGQGLVPDIQKPAEFSAGGRLVIESLAGAGEVLALTSTLPDEPLSIDVELTADAAGYRLRSVTTEFRDIQVEVQGLIGELTSLKGMDLAIALNGPDIQRLFPDAGEVGEREIPFQISGRILGDEQSLELIGLELEGPEGGFIINGRMHLVDDFVGSRLAITGRGANLSALVPVLPGYQPTQEAWTAGIRLQIPKSREVVIEQSTLKVGSIELAVSGNLDLADQARTALVIDARGDSLNHVGRFDEITWPDQPFSVIARLDGIEDAIGVSQLEAHWGETDLSATGSISMQDKPAIVLRGRSSALNLIDVQRALFGEELNESVPSGRVIPDFRFPMEDLLAFDADVDVQVGTFRGRRAILHDIDLKLTVKEGTLELDRAIYRDDIGSFKAIASLRPENSGARLAFSLTGTDADLGIFTSPDQPRDSIPRYSLDVAASGTGETLAELAGNLNGKVLIASLEGGRINNALLNNYAGDFMSNVLNLLNPFVKAEPFTPMACMVANATITDGLINLEPGFVLRTDRVNMFVFGKLNLKTERLDLSLATHARQGIGLSAATITNPYFKVGGTLSAPALQLDPTSAAIAASAATATAGLSIVIRGFLNRLRGEQNPCPRFFEYQPKR